MRRFTSEELYTVRNKIPVKLVISGLLGIPNKEVEGVFRFLCPECNEFETGVHEETNLSRCFRCEKNFNTIELVMRDQKKSFVESVKLLKASF